MFDALKRIFGFKNKKTLKTPVEYPGKMSEIVGNLIFVQTLGTGLRDFDDSSRMVNKLAEDRYCLGYMMGMFDCLCQNWNVPDGDDIIVIGAAFALLFDGMDENNERAIIVGQTAFHRAISNSNNPLFSQGQIDGGSELKRYGDTKDKKYIPKMLHEYLLSIS